MRVLLYVRYTCAPPSLASPVAFPPLPLRPPCPAASGAAPSFASQGQAAHIASKVGVGVGSLRRLQGGGGNARVPKSHCRHCTPVSTVPLYRMYSAATPRKLRPAVNRPDASVSKQATRLPPPRGCRRHSSGQLVVPFAPFSQQTVISFHSFSGCPLLPLQRARLP